VARQLTRRLGEGTPRKKIECEEDDVQNAIRQIPYMLVSSKDPNKEYELFDQAPIFFTLKLHELFNYHDPIFFGYLMKTFSSVFVNEKSIKDSIPETVTRFFEDKPGIDEKAKYNTELDTKLLSTRKRVEFTTRAANKQHRIQRSFTSHELACVRETHRLDTGEDVKDLTRLRALAGVKIVARATSDSPACERDSWRKNAIESKIKCGMIHPKGVLKLVISDVGLGLLATARAHLAQDPEKGCPDAAMRTGAAFLRPYKPPSGKGTCAGNEETIVEASLDAQIELILSEIAKAESGARDGHGREGGEGGEDMDVEAPIDEADDMVVNGDFQ